MPEPVDDGGRGGLEPTEPVGAEAAGEPSPPADPPVSGAEASATPSFEIDPLDLESLPDRYSVREDEEARVLTCVEAPTVTVRIEKGLVVPASNARKYQSGTIFLDGAAAGEPFLDVGRRVYNLDHHEGCVRAFTLATCEQAVVLVRKGLDLARGDWTILANEPDLDTVLAIWVLLNHRRFEAADGAVRQAILPLVRLEGAIDAHGMTGRELVAFPEDLLARTEALMELLRREELELKSGGLWSSTDFLAYTARTLRAVDALVYSPRDFEGFQKVEELARIDITKERIAVVCRSDSGIYEVEQSIKQIHGNRVGLIVLQKDPQTYTLRQVDSFLPERLDALYERLNLVDSAVTGGGAQSRWGGSAEIGGSPRATGTALSPQAIARVARWVHSPPSRWQQARSVGLGSLLVLGWLAVAATAAWGAGLGGGPTSLSAAAALARQGWFGAILAALALLPLAALGAREPRRYGLRPPAGLGFLALLPVAVAAGVGGGAALTPPAPTASAALVLPALLLPLAFELLLRGAVHGLLFDQFRVQRARGPWFVSGPTTVTTALGVLLTALLVVPVAAAAGLTPWVVVMALAASVLLGLCCGFARERGESLLPPVVLHLVAALSAAFLPALLR